MKPGTLFSESDWVEIEEALRSKIHMIESGQLGPEDWLGQDKEWITHLRRIIRTIEGLSRVNFKKALKTKQGGK